MIEILANPSFWLSLAGPLVVVLAVGYVIAKSWRSPSPAVDIQWEAFNSPSNTAITVAGVATPLVTGLVTYSLSTLKQTPEQVAPLIASAILMSASILLGLWITFGLATLVGKEGTFQVSQKKYTYYPAFLVSQLSLLFFAFGLLVYYCLKSLSFSPTVEPLPAATEVEAVQILRPRIAIGMKGEDVSKLWGTPQAREATAQGELLKYQSQNAEYVFQIVNGEVMEVTERKTKK